MDSDGPGEERGAWVLSGAAVVRRVGSATLAYHEKSGDTHLLGDAAAAVMSRLVRLDPPCDEYRGLLRGAASALGAAPDDIDDDVAEALEQLCALDLVLRERR